MVDEVKSAYEELDKERNSDQRLTQTLSIWKLKLMGSSCKKMENNTYSQTISLLSNVSKLFRKLTSQV